MNTSVVKSPYPYFGGKGRVAKVIWQALGEVSNYVEPFAGSLAVLLANPKVPKIETVNDLDCFIANFWRAVANDPDGVAEFADTPIHEADLHARHQWLLSAVDADFIFKMHSDPNFYDLKIAGWWVWGIGASVGNNWLQSKGLKAAPLLSSAGGGIHGLTLTVHDWMTLLQKRVRRTRMCCGDWSKLVTPAVTYGNKGLGPKEITAVFLDPPYDYKGRDKVYKEESNVWYDAYQWAIDNGDNPKLRIALCGYEGDYDIPESWQIYAWKTNGGMANLGDTRGKDNSAKERIFFSPHCLKINSLS